MSCQINAVPIMTHGCELLSHADESELLLNNYTDIMYQSSNQNSLTSKSSGSLLMDAFAVDKETT